MRRALPRAAIDWRKVHAGMKRPSVTLVLLWQEYRAEQADGYGYSRFCDLYSEWRKTISATMRQTHPAGEKLFVDYAGDTMPVFDQITDTEHPAHIFVAALGASNYTYAEARERNHGSSPIRCGREPRSRRCGVRLSKARDCARRARAQHVTIWPKGLPGLQPGCRAVDHRAALSGGQLVGAMESFDAVSSGLAGRLQVKVFLAAVGRVERGVRPQAVPGAAIPVHRRADGSPRS